MTYRVLCFCLAVLLSQPAEAQQSASAADPAALESATRAILARMVASNTTASEGATTPLADSLAAMFRSAGFDKSDVMVIGPNEKSRNLIVRWRGSTRARPILLNAHLDVVEAPPEGWTTDPWVLTEVDGYLYGRGVLDDKGPAAAAVAAMLALRKQGVVPKRDIVLALTAGEETDIDNGVQWLLANHRDLVDAEYVLNLDAGGSTLQGGRVRSFSIQVAEKIYLDLTLSAAGMGGHSSVPRGPNPIYTIARAVDRLSALSFPVSIGPLMREYFAKTAPLRTGGISVAMAKLARDPADSGSLATVLADPHLNAQLRTTCVTTILEAGSAPNAIPPLATATVNCRLLPGTAQADVVETIRRTIADTAVTVTVISPAVPSDVTLPQRGFAELLERILAAEYGAVPVIPYMETGATDALWFRNAGIPAYGVSGLFLNEGEYDRAHGIGERISLSSFGSLVRYSDRLLRALAGQ